MKPIAIIQARLTSTRLPGKVLKDLAGQTVLALRIRRCQLSRRLASVVLATTDEPADDCLCTSAQSLGIEVFRGSREDVLDRYLNAARCSAPIRSSASRAIARSSSRRSIDAVIESFERTQAEFIYTEGFPRGTGDAELVPFAALERAWNLTRPNEAYYREHVITYHWKHPHEFRPFVVEAPAEIRKLDYRLCVDEADDLAVIRRICEHFAPRIDFNLAEVIEFLGRHPEVAAINRNVAQKTA